MPRPFLVLGLRNASTQKQKSKPPRGVVGKALKAAPPPKLPKSAMEQYVKSLRANGAEAARRIVETARDPSVASTISPGPWELTSEEKTQLMDRYLPEEQEQPQALRKRTHKAMWRLLKKRDWRRFDACFEELRSRQVAFDEVTYNLEIFGVLCNPRRDKQGALEVLERMTAEHKFNPVLLRLHSGFLDSYFELREVDAAPNPANLGKLVRTFWRISKNFKKHRIKDMRKKLAMAAGERRRRLQEAADAGELLEEGSDDDLSDDSDNESNRRSSDVRFPARGPPKLRGIHKGSGAPRQRKMRWKL